ncbi:MAG: hypothetical protein KDC70_00135 [Saprospiraceae bacterium]|nr:hypothetical protein [Saprospiraceae bacterium]
MGAMTDKRTLTEWADLSGKSADSVMRQARRKFGQGMSKTSVMSAEQWALLYGGKPSEKRPRKPASVTNHPTPAAPKKASPGKTFGWRGAILYLLMAIPALASLQNMHTVTLDITGHEFSALLLTGLFSASPFLFVLAGMKNRITVLLVGLLIAYECFCNFTRIYGGLTGFGRSGFPTRFLGLVTDVFNTGTHGTALALSGIMAGLAAAVFYIAYNELSKK